jgi:hypothetical protein
MDLRLINNINKIDFKLVRLYTYDFGIYNDNRGNILNKIKSLNNINENNTPIEFIPIECISLCDLILPRIDVLISKDYDCLVFDDCSDEFVCITGNEDIMIYGGSDILDFGNCDLGGGCITGNGEIIYYLNQDILDYDDCQI